MAFKISLRSDLLDIAVEKGAVASKTEVAEKSGLSYPTVIALSNGKHGETTYDCLAHYLEALGINPYQLAEMKFSDIFKLRE